jgi:hypothetical protein
VAGKEGSLGTPDCVLSCPEAVQRTITVLCSGRYWPLGHSCFLLDSAFIFLTCIIKYSRDYPQRFGFALDTVPDLMDV